MRDADAHMVNDRASFRPRVQPGETRPTLPEEPPVAVGAPSFPRGPSLIVSPGSGASIVPPSFQGFVYVGLPNPDVPESIRIQPVTLPNLVREPGQPWRLRGQLVEVVNHGVLVERHPSSGRLEGAFMGNAETDAPDGFAFQPRGGGPLVWENAERAGADNAWALEAARFGEVMAYYYADRVISYANGLLAELGERPLPKLRVVVNAHAGSRLPGYRQDDGDQRYSRMRPFPGGHYRLPSTFSTELPFRHPIAEMNPTGEAHLGPGSAYIKDSRGRQIIVEGRPYLRNAAHVPGIITHEVGHHVNAHTADFVGNRDRKPHENSNRKLHMDEGTADYWAAVALETPDIYNWHNAAEQLDDPDNRDLSGPRTTEDFERRGDPHRNGNIWASALWDARRELGARPMDLLVMRALVLCSRVGPSGLSDDVIQKKLEQKNELRDGLAMLLKADDLLYRGQNRLRLLDIFAQRGIDLVTPDREYSRT